MKHIKKFEIITLTKDINVGDYVILNYNHMGNNINNFFSNNIGCVIHVSENKIWTSIIYPKNIIPTNILTFFKDDKNSTVKFGDDMLMYEYSINISDILEYAHTKEELELKLASKKYNL